MAPSTATSARVAHPAPSERHDWARPVAWTAAIAFCLAVWIGVAVIASILL